MQRSGFRRLTRWLVWAVALAVALATVVRLVGIEDGIWPIPSATAFTIYLVPVAAMLAVVAALLRHWGAAVLLAGCAAAVGLVIAPRALPEEQPAASPIEVRVMTVNLLHGSADAAALAELVRQRRPDVVAFQEISPSTTRLLRRAGVFDTVPHLAMASGRRWNDTGIASRWPVRKLERTGLPSVYLAASVEVPGRGAVPVVSAHPTPPIVPAAQQRWARWLEQFPGPEGPLAGGLVAGDFNATLDHPEFRAILARGWRDAARERGEALTPTWRGAKILRLTLDHVLVPPGAAVRGYRVDALSGTDHRVVTATVALPPATSR